MLRWENEMLAIVFAVEKVLSTIVFSFYFFIFTLPIRVTTNLLDARKLNK